MRRYNLATTIAAVTLILVLVAGSVSAQSGKSDKSIFDRLMPDQEPSQRISLPDPPPQIQAMLQDIFESVKKVDLWSYQIRGDVSEKHILNDFEKTLSQQGWDRRVSLSPGRGFDAVYSQEAQTGLYQLMLIEINGQGNQREVTFTKIAGVKGGGAITPRAPTMRKEASRSISTLEITASGPSLHYEAWPQEVVEINRIEPAGQLPMPDITSHGSVIGFHLSPASVTNRPGGAFGMQSFGQSTSGLDFIVHGPKRLAVGIQSTGSPLTINLSDIKQLDVKATNAPVTVTGSPSDAVHRIEAINQKIVLSLGAVQNGELRVKATNAEITATLLESSNVELSANAVAGAVHVKSPGSEQQTRNPANLTMGSGKARIILESVSGNITVNVVKP